jgi:hypothetical protein
MSPPLSLDLPPKSARRRQRRTRYMRIWRRRKRDRCTSDYVEYHRDFDIEAMIRGGFLKAEDRNDRRKVRAALQRLANTALDRAAAGQFTYYESGAVGRAPE